MMRVIKGLSFLGALAGFVLVASVAHFFVRGEEEWRRLGSKIGHHFAKLGMSILNFDLDVKRATSVPPSCLIVANHLSYFDIVVMAAQMPTVFITSNEIRETPFLGYVCKLGGCVFIERRNRENVALELAKVEAVLRAGQKVVLFAEGTSTNGETVLPFKKTFFAAALNAGVGVLPICLRYLASDGRRLEPAQRDSICWYGDMTFFPHLLRMLALRSLSVRLEILDLISGGATLSRDELALEAHRQISLAHSNNTSHHQTGNDDEQTGNDLLNSGHSDLYQEAIAQMGT